VTVADLRDSFGRPLRDLRISVTDRCNFRCTYCMPKEIFGKDFPFMPKDNIMTFEEIDRLAGIFISLGVKKIRLTGGEPLLRRNIHQLISMLSLRDVEVAMTTNGVLLPRYAPSLSAAGLDRITVSLDALDESTFATITDSGHTVAAVLAGIEAAESVGLGPIKINTVIKRDINEDEILQLVERFSDRDIAVRFIEYMDVGNSNGWSMDDVVSAEEIREAIGDLSEIPANNPSDVSKNYRLPNGGEVGIISSVTEPFCNECTRARISSDGKLFTCLFSNRGLDIMSLMRDGKDDTEISNTIKQIWKSRDDRYSEIRSHKSSIADRVEMSYIGG